MKVPKRKSIQSFLSSYFVLFSLLLLTVMTVIICRMQYTASRDDTIAALRRTSLSAADSVDQHLNQMNQISLNAISSRDVKDAFEKYFSPDMTAYERYQQNLHLANALTYAKGFDFSIRQLNVYTLSGEGFGVGEEIDDLKETAADQIWYEKANEAHGLPVVSISGDYVSLSRMFFNSINVPMGYVEVKKDYDSVFGLAEDPGVSYPVLVHIYDKDGSELFPHTHPDDTKEEAFSYYELSDGESLQQTSVSGKDEIVCFADSEKMDLVVAVSAEKDVYLRQVYSFLLRILPIFLIVLILLLILSFLLSRRISSPIRHIYHFCTAFPII